MKIQIVVPIYFELFNVQIAHFFLGSGDTLIIRYNKKELKYYAKTSVTNINLVYFINNG